MLGWRNNENENEPESAPEPFETDGGIRLFTQSSNWVIMGLIMGLRLRQVNFKMQTSKQINIARNTP